MNSMKKIYFLEWINPVYIIILLIVVQSCERLDLKRVMDTSTDSISIRGTTVIVYGTVLDKGQGEIISHGHCWATHVNPDINDYHSDLGTISGQATFFSKLTAIRPGIEHFVRSYIYDGNQYKYSDEINFEINADDLVFNAPVIRKLGIGTIIATSNTTGIGSVTFAHHGHCWSQSENPTINNDSTNLGLYQDDSSFSSTLKSLVLGRYYIRGYLENDGEIIYSKTSIYDSEISVKTGMVTNGANNFLVANGEIQSLGIKSIIDHGFCYSEYTSNPNYNDDRIPMGPIFYPSPFSIDLQGLNSGHKYYIRAYASDGSRIYYGEIRNFDAN
jgi:hypothetical protein